MSSAKPLKIPAASPSKPNSASIPTPTNEKPSAPPPPSSSGASNPSDITSPHELTAFVETLLERLDTKFDEMSTQILERMNQMSSRVDALEASIQDIINGDISGAGTSCEVTSNFNEEQITLF
ncbi:heat shock factor-binding 1-like protein [Pyrrhoderma noxium]|uniref:Heat shock factor-binding 1-like protein n=1 Tax=Pyrrhoderma noxium TaxID=2282107 RepID=A0A286U960_9AGAM|nr:heat shock factor-binding 1-like protein [Pyrrhoderma noxium]